MATRKFLLADPGKPEGSDNPATRARIDDALLELMAEGERLNHDLVAARAGVSRRTVYRYYADRDALLRALWARLSPGPDDDKMPRSIAAMLAKQRALFDWFDENATAMTVTMASAEGRRMRNAMKPERVAAYREALGAATAHLDEAARTKAVAAIQLLNSGFAWREMRDQWDLAAPEIADACRWAIETLVAELERGGGPG